MKTRKIVLLIIFLIGIISLWLMSSFSKKDACEYATSNIEYIKEQIELAMNADDFEKSKYFAYKALNSIEKTQSNFMECGCEGTVACLKDTAVKLKNATKTASWEDSKKILHQALENTKMGLEILEVFNPEKASIQSSDILQMNTREAFENEDEYFLPHQHDILKSKVHNCLLGFESSLEKVVADVECNEALDFINNIYTEASEKLLDTELSEAKKQYHQRVRSITKDALTSLGDCSEIE